ncbi:MAG: phage gp6-like head-tail connector protein [Acidobacteria bacterium]|nr:phage gp6-like head-tail connector protein [Acidobacteriota bacterium]
MGYVASKDNAVAILHVVRDSGGSVYTGSATGFSVAVLDEGQSAQNSAATWSEPCTSGYLTVTLTPDATGTWLVRVTNPAAADGLTYEYQVQVVLSAAGLTPTGTWLTTLAKVRRALGRAAGNTDEDALLEELIAEASTLIESRMGRAVVSATYTEYHDGGGRYLNLRQGPLISVTSVCSIDWSSGSPVASTTLSAGTYMPGGNDTGWRLPGYVQANNWTWTRGDKLWRVIYVAGWASVPYDLDNLCRRAVIWLYNQRSRYGTTGIDLGGSNAQFRSDDELIAMIDRGVAAYVGAA